MPEFTSSTFSGVYKDDYTDSDGYHKVLFNSGRALQGRELNQLQTILQKQITRMGNNLFQDGAAIMPKSSGAATDIVDYVVVESLAVPPGLTVSDYIGATFTGPATSGQSLRFRVTNVLDQTSGDNPEYATLYGRYESAGNDADTNDVQTSYSVFSEGDTLTFTQTPEVSTGIPNLVVRTQPGDSTTSSTGRGVIYSIQSAEFYTQGHFVYVPKQSLVISKYSDAVDCVVGFRVVQDIVTTAESDSLYDNQGSRPNLSSPGADRYRIRMVLAVQDPELEDEEDFVTFSTIRNSAIVQIKGGNDNYNEIEKRMASRHGDTHGNFIVNDFNIQFYEGEDSVNMVYEIPSTDGGITPLAYLNGYRLEHQVPINFNSEKPRTFITETDQSLQVSYKNYVTLSGQDQAAKDASLGGFNSWNDGMLRKNTRQALVNSSNDVIGNTRIKSISNRNTGDSDNYRAYLYDVRMNSGENFRDVRKIRNANAGSGFNAMVPNLEDGNLYLQEPSVNNSLFEIPGGRVKSISVTRLVVQRHRTVSIADGATTLNLTCNLSEEFVRRGEWIFIKENGSAAGEIVDVPTSSITGNGTTVTVSGLTPYTGTTGDYSVIFYIDKNPTAASQQTSGNAHKSKTYTEGWFTATRQVGQDLFRFTSLYDGVELLEAKDSENGSADYLHKVGFDNGSRDNFYGPVVLRPDGVESSVTTMRCKVGYFEWGTGGDFFSVDSYELDSDYFSYGDIPTYISRATGEAMPLHNYLDFRPILRDSDINEAQQNESFDLPSDGGGIAYNVEFYNNRVDHVALTLDEDFKAKVIVNKGKEAQQPIPPAEKSTEMVLFDVLMNGNTKSVTDILFNRRSYRSYKMTDINELNKRVAQLEETVSLSALETEASNLVEFGPGGIVRSKTGFFVDDFSKGYAFTASSVGNDLIDDASFATSSYDDDFFAMHPKLAQENVGFVKDVTNVSPSSRVDGPSNTRQSGEMLTLDYVEVLDPSMKQEMISWKGPGVSSEETGYYNVNPFNVFMGEGVLRLLPSRDSWIDQRRLPDKHINAPTIRKQVGKPLIPRTLSFSRTVVKKQWVAGGSWIQRKRDGFRIKEITSTTTTVKISQRVVAETVSDQSFTKSLGTKRVGVYTVPFMRQKRVFAHAQGLRPDTRYWCYMDDVPMQQWVRHREKAEWNTEVSAGAHKRQYSSSNVNITNNPFYNSSTDTQVLMTDRNGELHFELWIPNNSAVPVPNSGQFNSVGEWNRWQRDSRRLAKKHGSVKSVNALNARGGRWKFRCGSLPVKLLDISEAREKFALSSARTLYTAAGEVNVKQKTLETTRVVTFKQKYELEDLSVTQSTSTSYQAIWTPKDPLAQTFTVDAGAGIPGVFVTSIDIFLHKAPNTADGDLAIPLELQIRGVDAGVPERAAISEHHRVHMTADSAYSAMRAPIEGSNFVEGDLNRTSKVLARPVNMKFKEPAFLRSGEEYSFVLLAETDNYEAYVATTYDLRLGSTRRRVSKQPSKGSLFLSQNGSTWTPKQNQDMAYRIYTAKFKSEGSVNFYNSPLEKFVHNYDTSLSVDSDRPTHFRVEHHNHGLGVGDSVQMEGLPNGNYKGVSSLAISDPTNVVVDPDIYGYYVEMPPGNSFDSVGSFGATTLQTNRAFPADQVILNFTEIPIPNTSIQYSGSFVSGLSHMQIGSTDDNDSRFDIDNTATPLENGNPHYFRSPKYVGNQQQEFTEISPQGQNDSAPSIIVNALLVSEQTSKFGKQSGVTRDGTPLGSEYTSDISPVIDTQTMGMILTNNIIDFQVDSAGEAATKVKNKPANFVAETHPTLGTSPSKHITKVVQLQQASGGLKVLCDLYIPPSADFELYYRTGAEADDDLYGYDWELASAQNDPGKSLWTDNDEEMEFKEHRFLIGGETGELPDFISFQIKVVLKSTNTCQSPAIKSIRAIALA